jgi:amidase
LFGSCQEVCVSEKAAHDSRRSFLKTTAAAAAALGAAPLSSLAAPSVETLPPFELEEITISALRDGIQSGKYSCRQITEKYLARIDAVDKNGPGLNAVIEINPDALVIAEELDRDYKTKGARGPLHGVPVLIKDNLATHDRMQTTAGSLALVGSQPPEDSFVAKKLRQSGAVILGKTNLSEWANIRSSHSSSGWSGRGGQTHNPYALDRNPCGSSSGSGAAVSGNLCTVAIGTETDGSIVCPSNANGIVGIKPTVGLVSRFGIIPISHSLDTAGPMARTVADAAALLTAIAGYDPNDDATAPMRGKQVEDYTRSLDPGGLKGARLGVVRKLFGFNEHVDAVMKVALEAMEKQGATLIDPVEIDSLGKFDEAELDVLMYELKADLNKYLAWLGPNAPVKSLQDVIEFDTRNAAREMPYFGQDLFLKAQAKGPLTDKAYIDARAKCVQLTRSDGIDAVMDKHNLDALVAPTGSPAWLTDLVDGDHDSGGSSSLAAVAGYPDLAVPAGFIFGLPVCISFFGRAWSEGKLIRIAYAFEQTTKHRRAPHFAATADVSGAPASRAATISFPK